MAGSEPSDMSYGKAMVRGVVLGWIFMPIVVLAITWVGAPQWGWAYRLATAAVVGFWVGLFFGGVSSVAAFMIGHENQAAADRKRTHGGRPATAVGADSMHLAA